MATKRAGDRRRTAAQPAITLFPKDVAADVPPVGEPTASEAALRADAGQGMEGIRRKGMATPDEVRRFDHGHMALIRLGDVTIGRAVFEPGWRWSTSMKALYGTDSCELRHVGYVIRGRLHLRMDDGTEDEAGPGDVITVRPGHDAWVVGDEPVEYLELASAGVYAVHA